MYKRQVAVKTNLEIACAQDVLAIALKVKPDWALLVPESREEVTTEGGLNVAGDEGKIRSAVDQLKQAGIQTSLFVDPDLRQVEAAAQVGADAVELHTGPYALATRKQVQNELERLKAASTAAIDAGLRLHAGHGLNYTNVRPVAKIPGMLELNIGHSIVSRAVFVGMKEAVSEMRRILDLCSP